MISIASLVAPSKHSPPPPPSCLVQSPRFDSHLGSRAGTGREWRVSALPPPPHRSSIATSDVDLSASIGKADGSSFRMVASHSVVCIHCCHSPEQITRRPCDSSNSRLHSKNSHRLASQENVFSRRITTICSGASLVTVIGIIHGLTPSPIKAEETNSSDKDESDGGVVGAIKSIFDPNEKTKSGKVLPKAYLKSVREVVKTLRESLEEDSKDVAKFRRTADAAKESIREYLSDWRGQKTVIAEESYAAIEKAIRSLANFYSKAGPFATMTEEVKTSILDDLKTAEAYL